MYFFDYLGAFYFWVWLNIWNSVNDTKRPTFKEVLEGKDRHQEGDIVDLHAYGLKLKFIGGVVTMVIVSILAKF
ncbi:hypothetical protein C7460_12719 [Marinoscillum furvescens DSM 4134]|uniref:Uncharacterized protein n=1 Tax=Marinoscillum furvescens DSM 4134 TaxID=1122208 RepID=A0A3D9KYS1_MARFU|nr:hypothetical protein C7460_12719 [Marinoscillum furvescens DSM 4134]